MHCRIHFAQLLQFHNCTEQHHTGAGQEVEEEEDHAKASARERERANHTQRLRAAQTKGLVRWKCGAARVLWHIPTQTFYISLFYMDTHKHFRLVANNRHRQSGITHTTIRSTKVRQPRACVQQNCCFYTCARICYCRWLRVRRCDPSPQVVVLLRTSHILCMYIATIYPPNAPHYDVSCTVDAGRERERAYGTP